MHPECAMLMQLTACTCCAVAHAEVRAIMADEGPDKTLVLYCSQGGVLESTDQHKRGWQTRYVR